MGSPRFHKLLITGGKWLLKLDSWADITLQVGGGVGCGVGGEGLARKSGDLRFNLSAVANEQGDLPWV